MESRLSSLFLDRNRDLRNSSSRGSRHFIQQEQQHYHSHQNNHASPPQSTSHYHHPLHHRLSSAAPPDDALPSRLLPPLPSRSVSGAPVPTDHRDVASIIAYRQRVNGVTSTANQFSRNQNLDWDQQQRRQVSLPSIHRVEGSSLRSDGGYTSFEEAARYRQAVVRELNRQNLRDDLRRNDHLSSVSLSELDNSRISAAISAKLFLDKGRQGGAFVPLTEQSRSHGLVPEREEAYYDARMLKGPNRIVERGSPVVALRKRNREDESDMERDRIIRQRRLYDPGLASLAVGVNQSLHLKRTPERVGDPPLFRRVLPGRSREVEEREDEQVASVIRASPPGPGREAHVPSFSALPKSKQNKHPAQHAVLGRTVFPERRSSSPRPESRHALPPRFEEPGAAQKILPAKKLGATLGLDTELRIREPQFWEPNARDKAGISKQELSHSSARRKESESRVEQRLGRHDQSEEPNEHKRSKKLVGNIKTTRSRSPDKEQQGFFAKRRLVTPDQKGSRLSRSNGKTSKVDEPTPRRSVKSQVTRVIGDTVLEVRPSKASPKPRRIEIEDDKGMELELNPAESEEATCKVVENVPDMRPVEETLPINHMLQQNSGNGHRRHGQSDANKQQQTVSTSGEKQSMLQPQGSQLPKVSISSPSASQKLHPSSESIIEAHYKGEADHEKKLPPTNPELILHRQQSFSVAETTFHPSYQSSVACVAHLRCDLPAQTSSLSIPVAVSLPLRTGSPDDAQLGTELQQVEGQPTDGEIIQHSLREGFLKPKGQVVRDESVRHNLHMDLQTGALDDSSGIDLRQDSGEAYLPAILEPQTVSQPAVLQSFEQLPPAGIKENQSSQCSLLLTSHQKTSDAFVESKDLSLEVAVGLGKTAKETTAEREVRLFGKTLKALVSETSQQPEEALTTDAKLHRNSKPDQTKKPSLQMLQDTHSEQLETSIASSDKVASHAGSSALNPPGQLKEDTGIPEAGPGSDKSSLKLQAYPPVRQDIPANNTPPKLYSVVTHQSRGRIMPTPARAGTHTWRRTANVSGLTGPQAASRLMKASSASNQVKPTVSQVASYVRKGNSLVRAPASSSLAVSSALNTGASHVSGKDTSGKFPTSGKLFSSHESSQRTYSMFRNAIKNTAGTFRKVFSAQKMPVTESIAGPSSSEKSGTPSHASDSIALQAVMGAGISYVTAQVTAQAARPATPETGLIAVPHVKNAVVAGDDVVKQKIESLRTVIAESLVDDGNAHKTPCSEATGSMMNATLQPKSTLPGSRPNSASAEKSETRSTYYVKSKANQLIATPPPNSLGLTRTGSRSSLSLLGGTVQDYYYKRKNNQLVRNSTHMKNASIRLLQGALGSSGSAQETTKVRTEAILQTTLGKVLGQKRAALPSSWVWTLNGAKRGAAGGTTSQAKGVLPLLFPWKRPGLGVAVRAGRFKALPKAKKGSLLFLISKKLQRLRKLQPVYTRSAHGFALHRSGVLSLGGANLKWTKSIEKRSKQASEEATKAVAAVEKKSREEKEAVVEAANAVAKAKADRRAARKAARGNKLHPRERIVMVGLVRYKMDPSKRTLQRLPDQGFMGSTDASTTTQNIHAAKLSTPRRLSIGGTEYVRLGNGNQLVRDPKAASRALASEKVRWSLHTARFRRAKRQQYCLFFTRFGKCNKSEGKCPYIHDPEKVAVCTKFLKGTCSGTNCLLTHKVIPERMPDCSYFLEGLCTNEDCPYRHVSVNPKAPICDGFLKGYCADGDECNKKHTCVCPNYAATGECSDRSTCKLHHPKKKGKSVLPVNSWKVGPKGSRRYFVTAALGLSEPAASLSFPHAENQESEFPLAANECMDFINLPSIEIDLDETDEFKRKLASMKPQLPFLQEQILTEEAEMWIKPVFLLQRQADPVVQAKA